MSKTTNVEKTLLAILALIVGLSFSLYIWNPNTQTVTAYDFEDLNNTIQNTSLPVLIQSSYEPEKNVTKIVILDQNVSSVAVNMSIEKYRASSKNGPWEKADSPIGDALKPGDEIYWKIEVNNTGEVALYLNYIDYYDGYILKLENYASPPSRIEAGETQSFIYVTHVFSGAHKNTIYVSGSYENTTIIDSDSAFYVGKGTGLKALQNEEIPQFVVPEFPLGILGGLLSILSAYVISKRRF